MTEPSRNKFTRLKAIAPVALTAALLGAALSEKLAFRLPPADAAPYHARVRDAAERLPYNIGPWLGTDTEVPPAAVALLRPNVIVSRQYQDVRTGRSATLLIVHCEDARDLIGHYPPVCYPAHGWSMKRKSEVDRKAGDRTVPVADYTFTSARIDRSGELRIDNVMVLPNGQYCRDMDGVERLAQDRRRKFFGAAQIQMVTDAAWNDADRADLFGQILQAAEPLLLEIRSGVMQ